MPGAWQLYVVSHMSLEPYTYGYPDLTVLLQEAEGVT